MRIEKIWVSSGRLALRTVVAPTMFLGVFDYGRRRGHVRDDEECAVGISCIAASSAAVTG